MPGNARRSQAAAAATPRFSPLVDNISRGISSLSLSGPQAPERHHLWFIPPSLALPPRTQNGPSHSKKKPINHVPRPRNAFILFKSHFIHQEVLPTGIAFYKNHQQVCRIVSQIWKVLPDEERSRFYALGDEEERLHRARFPAYKITAGKRRTKGWKRYLPIDESNMTPAEVTCKRIADMVLQNIRGEELATQIRGVVGGTSNSGLFNPTSLSVLSRKKGTRDGDMDFNRIVPTSRAKPVRKSTKGRANRPLLTRKTRSSSSKKKQSKVAMKPPRALVVNPSRLESFFSDNEWSGDLATDRNTSDTFSEAGLPTASVTSGGVSTESSVDAGLDTPSWLLSPSTEGDAGGDSPSGDVDVSPFDTPFDQGVLFEAYGGHWGSIHDYETSDKQYVGLHDDYTMDQLVYPGAQHGRRYEATQVPIGDLFTDSPIASPEPQTISPPCLL